MKKALQLFFLYGFFLGTQNVAAQLNFDTLSHSVVGPGTSLIELIETTKPWSIQVLEVDLTNPYLTIETVKAKDLLQGVEKTSSMANRRSSTGHRVVGAVNGDFYSGTGIPVNAQIANGQMVRTPISRAVIGISENNIPLIQMPSYSGKIISNTGEHPVNDINAARGTDQLILYNSFIGPTTGTNEYGNEMVCTPVSGWYVNDTVWFKAGDVHVGSGNTGFGSDQFVLSGHGSAASFVAGNIVPGDTCALVLSMAGAPEKLTSMIGGYFQIIYDGVSYINSGSSDGNTNFASDRHPRTAAGYSEDRSKLYLVTVDGRQAGSIGMSLPELADFMLNYDIFEAINLDGGGSTTMVINGKVVNLPSDVSGERSVANALLVISSAPEGSLNTIRIQPDELKMKFASTRNLVLNAYDEFSSLMEVDTSLVNWELTNDIGQIDPGHNFIANGSETSGYIKATYMGMQDSIHVSILPVDAFRLSPATIMTDSIIPVQYRAFVSKLNSTEYELAPGYLNWSLINEEVGSISQEGIFKGKKTGATQVEAEIGGVKAQAELTVEIYEETELLDNMELPESWTTYTEFIDSLGISFSEENHTEGSGGFEIYYQFTYIGRIPYFCMLKTIPVKGIPDSVWIDSRFNGEQYRVSFNMSNAASTTRSMYSDFTQYTGVSPIGAQVKTQDIEYYPYEFDELKVEIWRNESWVDGQIYSGTIYLDNLRVSYPGHTPIGYNTNDIREYKINSLLVYPNPAGEYLNIRFAGEDAPVCIRICDLSGRVVKEQKKISGYITGPGQVTYPVHDLESGMYIVSVNSLKGNSATKILVE